MLPEAEYFRVTCHKYFRMSSYRVSEDNCVVSIHCDVSGIGRFHR